MNSVSVPPDGAERHRSSLPKIRRTRAGAFRSYSSSHEIPKYVMFLPHTAGKYRARLNFHCVERPVRVRSNNHLVENQNAEISCYRNSVRCLGRLRRRGRPSSCAACLSAGASRKGPDWQSPDWQNPYRKNSCRQDSSWKSPYRYKRMRDTTGTALSGAQMAIYLLVAGCVALLVPSAATAQQSGTEREHHACSRNAQKYCRPVLGQGDFAVLACLQRNREKLSASCKKVLTDHGQ